MQLAKDNPMLAMFISLMNFVAALLLNLTRSKYDLNKVPKIFLYPLLCCHVYGSITYPPLLVLSSYLPGIMVKLAFAIRRVVLMVAYVCALITVVYEIPWYIVVALILPHLVGDFLVGLMLIRGKEGKHSDSLVLSLLSIQEKVIMSCEKVKLQFELILKARDEESRRSATTELPSSDAAASEGSVEAQNTLRDMGDPKPEAIKRLNNCSVVSSSDSGTSADQEKVGPLD